MRGDSFNYLLKQGITGLWLNRVMSLASVAILTACLVILGGAGLLSMNLHDIFQAVESQNEVVVFVSDNATDSEIETLGNTLKSIDGVVSVEYVTKSEALEEQKEYMGDEGYLLDGLEDDNPLPASYRVSLADISQMDAIQSQIVRLGNVDSVSAPTNLAETLTGIERTLLILGTIIIGILVVASLVVIGNTIKLTVFSRRQEINIMKYVGATNAFIRFPFLVEGVMIGLISALVAFAILMSVYSSITGMLLSSSVAWMSTISQSLSSFSDIWYWLLSAFVVSGVLIGTVGSAAAMKKHLQV